MGGGSKGYTGRPELPVDLMPNPKVNPIEQPSNPARADYSAYYGQSPARMIGEMIQRAAYQPMAPNASYAANRPPMIFRPGTTPVVAQTPAPAKKEDADNEELMRQYYASLDTRNGYGGGGN